MCATLNVQTIYVQHRVAKRGPSMRLNVQHKVTMWWDLPASAISLDTHTQQTTTAMWHYLRYTRCTHKVAI